MILDAKYSGSKLHNFLTKKGRRRKYCPEVSMSMPNIVVPSCMGREVCCGKSGQYLHSPVTGAKHSHQKKKERGNKQK